MGIEEGTFWDEHWVLYGNQFVNKFHIKNKIKNTKTSVAEDVGKKEPSSTVSGNANWYSHSGKQCGGSSKH